jgi:diguanylate cyclase (GGDEF)-like protein
MWRERHTIIWLCQQFRRSEHACAQPILFDDVEVEFTLSAGLAFLQGNVFAAMQKASMAMVMAKDSGRNELLLYDSMRDGSTDALTGINNRRYFDTRLAREMRRAANDSTTLTLAMLDLDDFGLINKAHGHTIGDDVLRRLATVVTRHVRPSDWLARYGGEEFCLILHAPLAEAMLIAERVREAVALETIEMADGGTLTVTVSIGLAPMACDGSNVADLVAQASSATRRAKSQGKNRTAMTT